MGLQDSIFSKTETMKRFDAGVALPSLSVDPRVFFTNFGSYNRREGVGDSMGDPRFALTILDRQCFESLFHKPVLETSL